MIAQRLPVTIDVLKLVDREQELTGRLELRQMARLRDLLEDDTGEMDIRLAFGRDPGRRAVITGRVQGTVSMMCQRCLKPMQYQVNAAVALGVCLSEDEVTSLPENYDPLLLEADSLRLAELVEDEVILALPTLARHEEDTACKAVSVTIGAGSEVAQGAPEKPNPFAVLDALKKRGDS